MVREAFRKLYARQTKCSKTL